jgi:tetratricopeptide (TPR) repeat protein
MRIVSAIAVYIGCMAAPTAFAQEQPPPPAAKVHYQAGAHHYARGHYVEAIGEFEEAYRLSKAPALLYNISQAYERLGDLVKARDYLHRYLESGATSADERGSLEDRVRAFDERIRADEAAKASSTQPATQPVAPEPRKFGVWKWVALGGGGALLVTAGIFAIDARRQENMIEDAACEVGSLTCRPYTYGNAWDRGERDEVLAWVTGGLGLAAVGAGVALVILERSPRGEASPSGNARISPLLAPHAAGATVGWKW